MTALSRLAVRLGAVTLIVGVVGGVFGGWVVRQSTQTAIQAEAERLTVGLSEQLANEIDGHIKDLATSFRVLVTREQVFSLSEGTELELAVALHAFEDVEELDVHDADGNLVAAVASDRLVDPALVPPSEVVALDTYRTELSPGNPSLIDITVPIQNPPGSVVGSLRGRMRIDSILQVLQARLLGSSAKAIFVGPDGVILDHPERNRVSNGEVYPVDLIPPHQAGSLERDGERVLAALATAPTSGLPGSVIIEWDAHEALSVADQQSRQVGILVALIVLATAAVVLVVTSRLVRPLDGLREMLRRFAEGDHDARVAEVGASEFQQVARDVNAMAAAVTDHIAELGRAHSDLTAAHARFRAAFEQAPVSMALISPTATFIDVNPALCALLGRTPPELLTSTVSDLTHPDHGASIRSAVTAAVDGGSAGFQIETSYVGPDGQAIPTLTNVACVRSPDGTLDYFIAHMVDLSDLYEAEDRFRRIINSSPDVFIVVDGGGVIELASARLADMFDYESDDLVGQHIEILVPERFRAVHRTHRMSHQIDVAREMGQQLELSGLRSDGSEFPVEISLTPIVMGGAPRVLATVRDVTKRLQGEAATRELSEMRDSQRRAIEINDNIVQGLTVARWSFDLGDVSSARRAVEATVEAARLLVDRMLSAAGDIEPGSLRRELPVGPE